VHMPDNDLVLRIPHTLGSAEAKRRIAGAAAGVKARYWHYLEASDFEWDANRLSFRVTALAQTIQGTIDVEEKFVELRAHLPFVIRALVKRFMPIVRDTGQKLLK
jgi:(p)ppGpp synthase/HD superfamily hydrolase